MKTKIFKFAYRVMVASLLIMMFVGCEKEEEVKPLVIQSHLLSKTYKVEFKLVSSKKTGDPELNGVFDCKIPAQNAGDTISLSKARVNFIYSFESNKVNGLYFKIKSLIPRGQYNYIATIIVDNAIVAMDSIDVRVVKDPSRAVINLQYVIEKY